MSKITIDLPVDFKPETRKSYKIKSTVGDLLDALAQCPREAPAILWDDQGRTDIGSLDGKTAPGMVIIRGVW